ncbi:MAG: ATP-binding cassette domain-containing protein [Bacteroidota bacterium]
MLSIQLHTLGKKFNKEWIFRDLSHSIPAGRKLLISGGNGSGKSTLLQVLSGFITPNEGNILYNLNGTNVAVDEIKNHLSFASPYLQLVEEFTLEELVEHIKIYKPFSSTLSTNEFMSAIELTNAKTKYIRQFSSGMKQRLKLGLAILSDTPLLLLDEPISNLDKNAIDWYKQLVTAHSTNRTIIVCSNALNDEHFFCDTELVVSDFKPHSTNKNL